jgi:hypothetical protein
VLRKASVLPITFLGGGSGRVGGDLCGVGGGGYSVVGSVRGVSGDVGGKCGGARLTHRYLITHPGTPCLESIARPAVFRVLLLEVREYMLGEYMLGAVSGPVH